MKMNSSMYRDMVVSAACSLDNQKDTINNLNVFPVPDGDTGINMSLTMSGVRGEFVSFDGTLGECAQKATNLMLRGARGNSGVILSLFFRGIAKAWANLDEADCQDIVKGFSRGVAEAYKAVMNPTEGTILTVMRVMTEAASELLAQEQWEEDIQMLFDRMLTASKEALDSTPELLPILREAGVVDSGGYGFVAVMEGMLAALNGAPITAAQTGSEKKGAADFRSFQTEDIRFAYCTECIVGKSPRYAGENTTEDLHRFIMKLGDSVVYVDDSELIKLHVHTNDPGRVLTEALRYGALETVKIENMKQQHSSLSGAAETATPQKSPEVKPEKKYGFVTVCMGQGMEELFTDLAADKIVCGGQTMNPSTDEIVRAVQETPAEFVFILPNNKNIYMVSQQAAKIVKNRHVVVLNTTSVPEGVAAMLAFDPEMDCAANEAAMQAAIAHVTTLSVTYAVRDTKIGETVIKEGEILGLIGGKIACSSATREDCVREMIESVSDAAVITVYYGEGIEDAEAQGMSVLLQERYPGAEIMVLCGAQPVYSYIISIE